MEDANINTAMEAEKEFVKDPLCITAYEQHQKYLRDKQAREDFVRREGITQGRKEGEAAGYVKGKAEGKAEAEMEFIKSLIASGMSVEEIASRLNKEVNEIRNLLN